MDGSKPSCSLKRCKVTYLQEKKEITKGFAAKNVSHLVKAACKEFNVPLKGTSITLDDGTEVEDDEYFALLPEDTLFVLVPSTKSKQTWRNLVWRITGELIRKIWRLPTPPKEDLEAFIEDLIQNDETRRRIQAILDKSAINLKDTRTDDPEWFNGLKKNVKSKETWMSKSAKERIRGYYVKTKDDVEDQLFGDRIKKSRSSIIVTNEENVRTHFELVFDTMRKELDRNEFCSGYFARNDKMFRLCDVDGWFSCQGEYDRRNCKYVHRINPYGNRESRILFSTWNLDHVIERSRSIVPSLIEAIQRAGNERNVNWKYFYCLLFKACLNDDVESNLKLVHTVCHIKMAHTKFSCDKTKYF